MLGSVECGLAACLICQQRRHTLALLLQNVPRCTGRRAASKQLSSCVLSGMPEACFWRCQCAASPCCSTETSQHTAAGQLASDWPLAKAPALSDNLLQKTSFHYCALWPQTLHTNGQARSDSGRALDLGANSLHRRMHQQMWSRESSPGQCSVSGSRQWRQGMRHKQRSTCTKPPRLPHSH